MDDIFHNFQVFLTDPIFFSFLGISKDVQCSESDFCIHDFFFLRILVFDVWLILYSTLVNSELETSKISGRDFCKMCR